LHGCCHRCEGLACIAVVTDVRDAFGLHLAVIIDVRAAFGCCHRCEKLACMAVVTDVRDWLAWLLSQM
jgi:hypothetical protein